jgi:hypothetical protein
VISSSGQKQTTTTPAITVNSLLRLLCPIKGFLFQAVEIGVRKTLLTNSPKQLIKVTIVPRKNSHYCFLKRSTNLSDRQTIRLKELLAYNFKTVRAYQIKESFDVFWGYISVHHARKNLKA